MPKLPIPFGNPNTYPGHSGVDFPVARGSVIRASGPGTVVTRARNEAGGFYVFVKYDAIVPAVGYHHMDSHAGVPPLGTRVQEGTQLGFVGSLGSRSTGPHLHSEVAGHRTTDGYWQFFDRNRVVGAPAAAGAAAGGSTKGEDVMNADQEGTLRNVAAIVTELRNMLIDPRTGLWKVAVPEAVSQAAAAKASADNVGNIAAEIRNLIVDPRSGVLAAIGRISGGDIDEDALATSLADSLAERLGPKMAAAVLDGAAQRLLR